MCHSHELYLFMNYFEFLIKMIYYKVIIYKLITYYIELKREYVDAAD